MFSRLKGIETRHLAVITGLDDVSCYMLSRLKGIETFRILPIPDSRTALLLYVFPFEGN